MPYRERLGRLQETLRDLHLCGAVLFYSRDVLYYTGTAQPAWLVVLPEDYLLVITRGYDFARHECALEDAKILSDFDIDTVCRRMFPGSGTGEKVGAELDILTVYRYHTLMRALGDRQLLNVSPHILAQRAVKDPAEIDCIKKACAAVHQGHQAVLSDLKAGMTELELAASVENAQRLAGHEGLFFMRNPDFTMSRGPLASGPNLRLTSGVVYTLSGTGLSRAVPAGPSRRVMREGDHVVIDIPACVEGYHADQSRTYALGTVSDRVLEVHQRLRDTADACLDAIRPGMTAGEIFQLALDHSAARGLDQAFMRFDTQPRSHFVGHGLGLELNEPPLLARNSNVQVEENMVLALEMHLMEPEGCTMKLEDTVHVTSGGVRILTMSPRDLTVVG
jgi:Xaa-Pro aminopeptidase